MKLRRWIVTALAVLGGLLFVVVALDVGTALPSLCSSCHELQPRAHAWSRSAHATVPCVKCHLPVRAWHESPQRVADRVGLLQRDWRAHLAGNFANPVENRSPGTPPMGDKTCLQCHDPNRKATSGFRIQIDHAKHAKRNGSCVSCHVRTAHPIESRSNAMSLMSQCFTCHAVQKSAKAPGECGVCHPSGYELRPASHKPKAWRNDHGQIVKQDPKQCRMCHTQQFCTNCHGLEMPHPAGWTQGGTKQAHGTIAKVTRDLCSNCHDGGRDNCTMCHHSGFQAGKGTWTKQHFKQVREEGLARCLDCHSPVFCSECHASGPQGGV